MNISKQYMENLYIQFINAGSEYFYNDILAKALVKMESCQGVDLELLHLSYAALERARYLESQTDGKLLDDWRNLAAILRKAVQKIHRECLIKSDHPNFLRLV